MPDTLVALYVFVLACFIGYYVVWGVTPSLHTPLVALTNAISGIVLGGALLVTGLEEAGFFASSMGFIAVLLASINVPIGARGTEFGGIESSLQDRYIARGLGLFAQVGIADEDTNPITWSFSIGLSGRGTIPGRDADTWGVGYFYNDLQDQDRNLLELENSTMGLEVYYDISLFGWAFLTLDAQWNKSAFQSIDNSTIIGARLNVSF